jgi:predicted transcriptional regulator
MVRYRNRLQIIVDILNVALTRARKTRIMYVANLSYKLLEKYLGEVVALGFISFSDDHYEVTQKGRAFLEKYNDFSSKYAKIEDDLRRMLFEREALEKLCKLGTGLSSSRSLGRRNRS